MKVDYTAIANADPGGDLNAAFATMAALTETPESRGTRIMNQTTLVADLGMDDAVVVRAAFEHAVGLSQLPSWLILALDRDGIDICHDGLISKLSAMVTANKLTQGQADAVVNLGMMTKLTWPRLTHGQLENAREKRDGEY